MSHGYKYQNQNNGQDTTMNMMSQNQGGTWQQNMQSPQNPYITQNTGTNMGQQNPYYGQYTQKTGFNIFGETPSDKLLRGLLIGGAAAYILTNENAQKAIIKTGVKLFGALAGGVEEFKEKIMDAKAELEAEKEEAAE